MNVSVPSTPSRTTADELFRCELEDELRRYAQRLRDLQGNLLVAISRKAPRLIQLIAETPGMPELDLSRCISEKALPFIARDSLRGATALVTDDTIVYGSTFVKHFARLSEAGAEVRGEVLAISKQAHPAAVKLVGEGASHLSPERIQQLIDLEIQAFGALAVPYDVDHPVLTIPFDGDQSALAAKLERSYPDTWRPTSPWHEAHGVTVLSLPIPQTVICVHSQAARRMAPQKLRLFLDAERGAVRIVAIFALALHEDELHDPELFAGAPGPLATIWNMLLGCVEVAGWPEYDRHLSLANAAHYLAGCEALWLALAGGQCPFQSAHATLSDWDLRLLFGPALATEIHGPLERFLATAAEQERSSQVNQTPPSGARLDVEAEIKALQASERGRVFLEQAPHYLAMTAEDDAADLIQSFFHAQRRVYDERTQGARPNHERLAAALLPFPLVTPLLRRLGADVNEHDFECFADRAIDGGSIVPHYQPALSDPTLWVRSVRAGERQTQKLKHWLYRCVAEAEGAYQRTHSVDANERGNGLPWYVSEKLFATLAAVQENELRAELGERITCGRDAFGARAELAEHPHRRYLLDWATDTGVIRRRKHSMRRRSGAKASGRFVSVSSSFRELHPEHEDTVRSSVRFTSRALTDAFIAIDALFEGEHRELTLLAISSCGSHHAYLCSISAAIEVWLEHKHFNPGVISTDLFAYAEEPPRAAQRVVLGKRLSEAGRTLAQVAKKQRAFRKRIAIRDEIDKRCQTDPLMAAYVPAWEEYIRPLIDEDGPEEDRCETYLLHAASLAHRSVTLVRSLVVARGFVSPPAGRMSPPAHHIERYREILEEGRRAGLYYANPPQLDAGDLLATDATVALRAAASMLRDTQNAVEHIWSSWRRPTPPGAVVPVNDDRVVLIWDLQNSTRGRENVQQAIAQANTRVRDELSRRGRADFVGDNDDSQAVVLLTARDALELLAIVAQLFETNGLQMRAGIETTTDGNDLLQNTNTGYYTGPVFAFAARAMDAFALVQSGKAKIESWEPADGAPLEPRAPEASYVCVTERMLKQLHDREGGQPPGGFVPYGLMRGYDPEVGGTLSADVTCYVLAP